MNKEVQVSTKTPFLSRFSALIIGFLAILHLIATLDLFLHFFPDTEEFRVMWSIGLGAKLVWVATVLVGAAAAVLLYNRKWLGFLGSLAFCVCLYFASQLLWQEVKGGFWLAVGASVLAGIGAMQPNNSKPLRGAA